MIDEYQKESEKIKFKKDVKELKILPNSKKLQNFFDDEKDFVEFILEVE